MIIIRPTASLAKRMKIKLQSTDLKSTTKLADWYALDLVLDRKQLILCVSSVSRLAVIMEAAPYATFPQRLCDLVTEVLRAIGVNESSIQEERIQMDEIQLAKTENKSILGSMNEYRFQLEAWNQMGRMNLSDTLEMSMYLSKMISLVLPDGYPKYAALKCFGQEPPPRPQRPIESEVTAVKPVEMARPKLYIVK
ncbi:MAG: hypothetical protein IPK68_09440 [Bdellovibrionales bacterium]|nr:hypothetical protein [Bdellovibrionales bacterium]